MSTSSSQAELLDKLAEEFADRYRRGERPTLEEYVQGYPHLADEIRAVFSALEVIEECASAGGEPSDPPAFQAIDDTALPNQLGEYRIVRQLGRGGMGVVYEAVQESLGRRVALKVLPPHPSLTPAQLARFDLEARTAARLHHTNIVPVYGVGSHDEICYYAMEFIAGRGLDEVICELRRRHDNAEGDETAPPCELTRLAADGLLSGEFGPQNRAVESHTDGTPEGSRLPTKGPHLLPDPASGPNHVTQPAGEASRQLGRQANGQYFRSVALIGIQVAEALAYAHRHGVLHRDIKPSNLLLDVQGRVWVTDFGLVKLEDAETMTRTGETPGTLMYMAPERFEGRSEPQSDVYSLGATLYELLTLQPPFKESSKLRLIERIKNEEPKWPGRRESKIPRDLQTIISKTMEKDPQRRYQSADELADDLRSFLSDRPVKARRISHLEHVRRWCRRNPAVACLSAVVLLLLLTIAVVASVLVVQLRNALQVKSMQLTSVRYCVTADPDPGVVAIAPPLFLKFGVYESEARRLMEDKFLPLIEALATDIVRENRRSVCIQVYIFKTYDSANHALVEGLVDFVRFGPVSYVIAKNRAPGIKLIAMELKDDKKWFNGFVIVRKDSRIKSICFKDLHGKIVVFGDPNSTISTKLIKKALAEEGLTADEVQFFHVQNHTEVAQAVLEGRADIGAVNDSAYEKAREKYPDELRVVRSFEVVTKPWIARVDLEDATFKLLKKGLLGLKDRTRDAEQQEKIREAFKRLKVTGFALSSDGAYDPTRDAMAVARKFGAEPVPSGS